MTEQKQISNSLTGSGELTATMIDRELNGTELDAVVGGSFLSAVKEAVLDGAVKAGGFVCCGGVRR